MSINIQFTDRDIDGFKFGQMIMTGYKKTVILECDYPDYGWKTGDMIVVDNEKHPCFRIEPLFGVKTNITDNPNVKTVKKCGAGIRLDNLPEETQAR